MIRGLTALGAAVNKHTPTPVEHSTLVRSVLALPDLTASDRTVMCLVALDGECDLTHSEIASRIHASRRTVVSALQKLEDMGYISRRYGSLPGVGRKRQVIQVHSDRIMEDSEPAPIQLAQSPRRKKMSTSKCLEVFARDNYTCRHCGARERLNVDHIMPWSKGGSDDMDNLQTLCATCNGNKGAQVEDAA